MVEQPWYPPGTDLSPPMPSMWSMRHSVRAGIADSAASRRALRQPFINLDEVEESLRLLRLAQPGMVPLYPGVKVPPDFVRPHLLLAPELWSDLLEINAQWFFSRPLREAMALPPEAAQFHPIELETTSDELRAKDYLWLSWLNIERNVIDPERSDCDWRDSRLWGEVCRDESGQPIQEIKAGRTMVVREDFRPRFDLFCPFEERSRTCATPALEQRVRASGCVGVGFSAFGSRYFLPHWMSDEDGLRIVYPGIIPDDLGPPPSVKQARARRAKSSAPRAD